MYSLEIVLAGRDCSILEEMMVMALACCGSVYPLFYFACLLLDGCYIGLDTLAALALAIAIG